MTNNEELIVFIRSEIAGQAIQQKLPLQGTWKEKDHGWDSSFEYRLKPKLREWWIRSNIDESKKHIFTSAANAKVHAMHGDEIIKVREVMDDK